MEKKYDKHSFMNNIVHGIFIFYPFSSYKNRESLDLLPHLYKNQNPIHSQFPNPHAHSLTLTDVVARSNRRRGVTGEDTADLTRQLGFSVGARLSRTRRLLHCCAPSAR